MCKAVEEFVQRRVAEVKAEGRAEGRAEGKAEGKAEGITEGKRETMFATARRMLKDGILALKDVARYSGLSLAQVKRLQSSMA